MIKIIDNRLKGAKNNSKLDSIQVLRFLAFLVVFLSHIVTNSPVAGGAGVSIFIVLSGFLMIYNYWEKDRGIQKYSLFQSFRFSLDKVKKLYPLHILMMLPAIVLQIYNYKITGAGMQFASIDLLKKVAAHIFLVQAWFPDVKMYFSLNVVSWYLSVCVVLYFSFPYIFRWFKKIDSSLKIGIISVGIFLVQILSAFLSSIYNNDFAQWFVYTFPLYRIGDFIIGCGIGYLFLKVEKTKKYCTFFELLAILIAIVSHIIYNKIGETWWRPSLLFVIPSVILIWVFALNNGKITHFLTNGLTVQAGNLSAYMFLIHQIIIRYLAPFNLNFIATCVVAFIITIVSTCVYSKIHIHFLEKVSANKK